MNSCGATPPHWQCDIATKRMRTLGGMYFLVFIHTDTRRCWISPCTAHPESALLCQQGRNFLMHAEEVLLSHKIILRDNDEKYSVAFDKVLESAGAEIARNTYESPNLRAHVER